MSSRNFYKNLPVLNSFFDASTANNYRPLPGDWHIALTDIVNSTAAINKGCYKTVNILGASPIVGILNVAHRNEIPFSFAGDGAVFCIPPDLLDVARQVLADSRQIGKIEYQLDLRAAILPVSFIRKNGYDVKVARYRVSDVYSQAVFSDGGIQFAEEILKNSEADEFSISPSKETVSANFTGLECRWQEVKQQQNEVITLLVKSNASGEKSDQTYKEVLQKLRDIFGFDEVTNPIRVSELSMSTSVFKLWGEVKFRTFGRNRFQRLLYLMKAEYQIILGKLLMRLNIKTSATDWSLYKSDLSSNSDHRKFDDMLRIVLSGSSAQRRQLEAFLEQKFQESTLAYGLHISNSAMITCMVFQYHREHVHFVDGSGGGYVKASKKLKRRMERLEKEKAKM
ncbi:MAG TPA: DUF3095 domain-containing protein [Balneolaceae bacterium]|nr:DUF3095 domain-containing protein [Balneolaceae bacterium]